jgi:hypothetical protein
MAGDHRGLPGSLRRKRSITFWAGLASLVICFSAARVISIGKRLAGRLFLGETKLRETKTAFQFVARNGGFAPLRGCNALQMVLVIIQVLSNRFAFIIALAATDFSGQESSLLSGLGSRAPAERFKQA